MRRAPWPGVPSVWSLPRPPASRPRRPGCPAPVRPRPLWAVGRVRLPARALGPEIRTGRALRRRREQRAPLSPGRKGGGRQHFLLCSWNERTRHYIQTPSGVSGPGAKVQPLPGRVARGGRARGAQPGSPAAAGAPGAWASAGPGAATWGERAARGPAPLSVPRRPPRAPQRGCPPPALLSRPPGSQEALSLRECPGLLLNVMSLKMTLFPVRTIFKSRKAAVAQLWLGDLFPPPKPPFSPIVDSLSGCQDPKKNISVLSGSREVTEG